MKRHKSSLVHLSVSMIWLLKKNWASEDEMAGRHHQCNEHGLGQTPKDGEGQGGLVCYSPWGCKESDTTGDWTIREAKIKVFSKQLKLDEFESIT